MQRHGYRNYDVQWWQGVSCDGHEVQRQGGEIEKGEMRVISSCQLLRGVCLR